MAERGESVKTRLLILTLVQLLSIQKNFSENPSESRTVVQSTGLIPNLRGEGCFDVEVLVPYRHGGNDACGGTDPTYAEQQHLQHRAPTVLLLRRDPSTPKAWTHGAADADADAIGLRRVGASAPRPPPPSSNGQEDEECVRRSLVCPPSFEDAGGRRRS
jgi:hypothetical protein